MFKYPNPHRLPMNTVCCAVRAIIYVDISSNSGCTSVATNLGYDLHRDFLSRDGFEIGSERILLLHGHMELVGCHRCL